MKQKIVIRLQLDDDKCRSNAIKMAAEAQGVSSVSLEGEERNQLVVTGFVDAVCLAYLLRKKFRCVTLVSVEEAKKTSLLLHYSLSSSFMGPLSILLQAWFMINSPTIAPSCNVTVYIYDHPGWPREEIKEILDDYCIAMQP